MGAGTAFNPEYLIAQGSGQSRVHRVPAQVKVLVLIAVVCAVVATPPQSSWPYLGQLAVLVSVAVMGQLQLGALLRGLAIEVPFVAFAAFLPFVASGPTVDVLGVPLSVAGLWGAWTVLAKSTLAVFAALILSATTSSAEFVAGLQRLHLPALMAEIMTFMVRYLVVITDQWERMSMARAARGFRSRDPRAWAALSSALGAGFIRTFERGERVHLAMLARGYQGRLPDAVLSGRSARGAEWAFAALIPALAWSVTALAWMLR